MAKQVSLSAKNSQNWLLSYTDLFLLVLSFFVLRFSILKYDKAPMHSDTQEDEVSTQALEAKNKLIFLFQPVKNDKDEVSIQIPINTNWFSNSELSAQGERGINDLQKKIEGSSKTAILRLPKMQSINQEKIHEQVSLLIYNLKKSGLTAIKIEMSLKDNTICGNSLDEHALACLVLDF